MSTYESSTPLAALQTDLKGKVALVTGASRGIGRAIAIKFASIGAKVAVNYSNNKAAAEEVVEKIIGLGSEAIAIQGNVADEQDASRIVNETIEHFGQIDILVNNAGIYDITPITDVETTGTYRNIMGVNVDGTFFVTRAAAPFIKENGSIINFSSVITKAPIAAFSVYAMSKGAVEAFTRALAVELGSRKIRVNTISPGMTETDMMKSGGDAVVTFGIEGSVFKRLGTPEDIAETAAFLVVPRSGAWVTGANILSNGGFGGFSI
ncbi:hypothetical protein HK100_000566 [Physocladia obscura]|uniref:Uncharacterized protein n=1 Tax=Physocladia obscura TaxID=109957 RepID=A0AAD5XGV4_9FUNG|nr:hypothetical protein HK100_000566 [Physocladia obscura]